ncbi:shikimate dehydrogenase [bacterium]|nr:shikimate dehydrogenase [bacterium]
MAHKFGLIGFHLSHSISGVIHEAGLKDLGVDATYEILETDPEDLVTRLKTLRSTGYLGFNVTIPLKVPTSLFMDKVDKYADIAGCVNTVKIMQDRTFSGYNTDIYGFEHAIPKEFQEKLIGESASIIGTGGASRAAAVGLIELGVSELAFFSRNIINAAPMVNYLRKKFPETDIKMFQIQSIGNLDKSAIVVNTTPVGMRGHSMDKCPLSYATMERLREDAVVYDVIYNPTKTLFLDTAEKMGHKTINGLDMLIHQAARAEELWLGKKPNTDKMKISALESLQNFE